MIIEIIIGVIIFIVGGSLALVFYQIYLKKKRINVLKETEIEAEVIRKDKILQAK